MKFHPDKCNVLSISTKRNQTPNKYFLHGHELQHVTSAKYLGVSISEDIKWNVHVSDICKKANNTIGFLKRNLNISNPHLKELAYKSLVRPIVEYACTSWDPHQQNNIHRLEMIQRRAARYVKNRFHNTSSVSDMLHQLEWESLEYRRKEARYNLKHIGQY